MLRARRIGVLVTCRLDILLHELPRVQLLLLLLWLLLLRRLELLKLNLHLDLLQVSLLKQLSQLLDFLLAGEESRFLASHRIMRLIQLAIVRGCRSNVTRVHQAQRLPFDVLDRIWMLKGVLGGVPPALFANEGLELLDPRLLALDAGFSLKRDPIVSIELFLQLNDCLVALV